MNQQSGPLAAPRNGLGTTALVLGIIGVVLAWIPIIGFFGFILAILAIVFGIIAVVRAHKGSATNMVVSYVGLGLGVLALAVSTIVFGVLANEVNKQIQNTTHGPGQSAQSSGVPSASGQDATTGKVVYEVTGSEGVSTITYGKGGQTSQATNVEVPWSEEARSTDGVEFYSLSAQNGQSGGDVTCKITVDGEVLAENTSNGPHALVTCNGNTGF